MPLKKTQIINELTDELYNTLKEKEVIYNQDIYDVVKKHLGLLEEIINDGVINIEME